LDWASDTRSWRAGPPVGADQSLTELGRSASQARDGSPAVGELFDLPSLDDIVFGGWDIFEADCYAARTAGVPGFAARSAAPDLEAVKPMPRCRSACVKRLDDRT
jgi:hypothetical protein